MDDESKRWLREIRDATIREEVARKRTMRVCGVMAVALVCTIAFLVARIDRLVTEMEQPSAPAEAAR